MAGKGLCQIGEMIGNMAKQHGAEVDNEVALSSEPNMKRLPLILPVHPHPRSTPEPLRT
jgi:hypothetical protein